MHLSELLLCHDQTAIANELRLRPELGHGSLKGFERNTLLHLSVVAKNKELTEYMLHYFPNLIRMHNKNNATALSLAFDANDLEAVRAMHTYCPRVLFDSCNFHHQTCLEMAISKCNEQHVNIILDLSIESNSFPQLLQLRSKHDNSTALHLAAGYSSFTIMKTIFECGVLNAMCQNIRFETPLHWSIFSKIDSAEKVQFWIKNGPPELFCVKDSLLRSPLLFAIQQQKPNIAMMLAKAYPHMITMTQHHVHPLQLAASLAMDNLFETMSALSPQSLRYIASNDRSSILHVAKTKFVAQYTFAREPSLIDSRDEYGNTVLHTCVRSNAFDVASFLLQRAPRLLFERNCDGLLPKQLCHDKSSDMMSLLEYAEMHTTLVDIFIPDIVSIIMTFIFIMNPLNLNHNNTLRKRK